ncbi:MAG: phage head closure protein [Acidovorax sp.]
MQAGKLNKRVTIQQKGAATNSWGEPLPDAWEEVAKVWARILHQSGMASIKADAQTSVVKASVRVRYRTDLLAGMRVLHGTTVYLVRAVLPDEVRREHVDLVCEQVT